MIMEDTANIHGYSIGEIQDTIIDATTGEIVEVRPWEKNVIVTDLAKLLASLLKMHPGYSGILYWAVGSGLAGWDVLNPPAPSAGDTKLVNEIGRKAIPTSAIKFLDASNNVSAIPTNKLLIELTFTEADCNGSWKEFAIIGGNATTTKDSGVLINHKTHAHIGKTSNMIVDRKMRFTFAIS